MGEDSGLDSFVVEVVAESGFEDGGDGVRFVPVCVHNEGINESAC